MTGKRFEYNNHYFQKLVKKESWKAIYKHWNNWCFKGGRGLYCFDKGYDEDYAKFNL